MNKIKKQSIRDLIFNPILYTEYPYFYEEKNEDGTTKYVFSKVPKVQPSLVDKNKYKKLDIKNLLKKRWY